MDLRSRIHGSLLGLATGDAVGTTLEFTRNPPPIDDMVGGGPFGLKPGQWTDDTSMALCLADSLVTCNRFDPADQMRRYVRWHDEGYLSSTGRCFDIGSTTRSALAAFVRTGEHFAGSLAPDAAGNGSLMRLAPIPLWFRDDPEAAIDYARHSSLTTHGAREAVDACRFYTGLIIGALQGLPRETLLGPRFSPVAGLWERDPLAPKIDAIAAGFYHQKARRQIRSGGYVVESLEAALWGFANAPNFRDGCLAVVNLGHDADTCGAIYGQLAGAYFGVDGIPAEWRAKLALPEILTRLADGLVRASA